MCKDCGCSITEHHHHHDHKHELHTNPQLSDTKTIEVITKILDKNDHEAAHNRAHFDRADVLAINLMSSPGSGKTTLLEKLAEIDRFKFAVIEGDLETNRDADRIRAKGIQAYQITTGSACHLDAFMVHDGLHHIDLSDIDVCFIENVGNLVCPASYDVGAHLNIVLVSVPEGDDKIEKYPVMFRQADLVLITKTDLLPYFDFDVQKAKERARRLKPNVDILEVSTKDEESIKRMAQWIMFKKEMR
ncbi:MULTISPECIES: hydrogenase nickel incorporation protein HypB [unclassified Nitratiruptor]|uniref:hydrogenase nickel incorporation protein HypB n=1 Tax=unclassified Nitratiruptor TaxID=2624044 RepID=UPI00191678DB|nr:MULTISPECIES: hydrogenase nickel incorporation protein HypB [unclassified Nitratiruptor]BCD60311.1 hydrogenase nickel incorporation protein HypB [Nitratiruptor sp. YY08-10]BCD64199.1 hydrogenase nickel incorporation protein HypB [Nitratiruptor sp. YY08-14]